MAPSAGIRPAWGGLSLCGSVVWLLTLRAPDTRRDTRPSGPTPAAGPKPAPPKGRLFVLGALGFRSPLALPVVFDPQ